MTRIVAVILSMCTIWLCKASGGSRNFASEEIDNIWNRNLPPDSYPTCKSIGIRSEYKGVEGHLVGGDCRALYLFANYSAWRWQKDVAVGSQKNFLYAETGSFLGLSSHIIAEAMKATETPALIYCHDVFDLLDQLGGQVSRFSGKSIWDLAVKTSTGQSKLDAFYSNVKRNELRSMVLPIIGKFLNLFHPFCLFPNI